MTRAFICGCRGTALDAEERRFLAQAKPLGVILFNRPDQCNVETPEQVLALTGEIRSILGDDAMVLIDQEGGRVQRLRPPHWRRYPAAARFAAAGADLDDQSALVRLTARLMAHDLLALGIDVDCFPVLDVPVAGAHDVIGDRAYGTDPERVAVLGRAAAEGMLDGGVLPVMKHVPGHGRAAADSHLALPIVDAPLATLEAADFLPFRRNRDLPAAMTAHVVYTAVDPERPATISPEVVAAVVRGAIGFDGLLFSDDLSMKALPGSFREKTEALFAAGVDVALHCSGALDEARVVAEASPEVAGETAARLRRARAAPRAPSGFDADAVAAELDQRLAATA